MASHRALPSTSATLAGRIGRPAVPPRMAGGNSLGLAHDSRMWWHSARVACACSWSSATATAECTAVSLPSTRQRTQKPRARLRRPPNGRSFA